jgi:cellulose synthase/poly-beta-1,6-N-acetylglucosamine synthase-like glycosyltransferase
MLLAASILFMSVGVAWPAYTYAGYPIALWFLSKRSAPSRREPSLDRAPHIALVVSAFNEEASVGFKLENSLTLDYPPNRFGVWVSSDGSTDRTVEIARRFAQRDARVRVIAHPVNRGKTAALMDTLRLLPDHVDVVVFSDANAAYDRDALSKLAGHFEDPAVGVVAGELVYSGRSAEGVYRRYENAVKRLESQIRSCMFAEGSIFAARRALIPRIENDEIEDLAIPLAIALAGHRVVYEPAAVSTESFELPASLQYERRRRIVNRAVRTTLRHGDILRPWRSGALSIMFYSHRVARWLSPIPIVCCYLGACGLAVAVFPALPALLLIVAVTVSGLAAAFAVRDAGPILGFPWAALVALCAMAAGVASALRGVSVVAWQPRRAESPSTDAA